jgi:alpha/beta superfamily hydrolase
MLLSQIIHCEHDKISTHVYRHNHDRTYNTKLPEDGDIEHVFYQKFEHINENVENFLKDHGRT